MSKHTSPSSVRNEITCENDSTIEAARSEKGFVQDIGAIRRRHQDNPFLGIEPIHFNQKLIECLLSFVVASANPRSAMAAMVSDVA